MEAKGKIIPLEIKASRTINSSFFDTLDWFARRTDNQTRPILVYAGDHQQERSAGAVIPWSELDMIIQQNLIA